MKGIWIIVFSCISVILRLSLTRAHLYPENQEAKFWLRLLSGRNAFLPQNERRNLNQIYQSPCNVTRVDHFLKDAFYEYKPEYIGEIKCNLNYGQIPCEENTCVCVEQTMEIHVFRRKKFVSPRCWEPYKIKNISVGCECMLRRYDPYWEQD